MRSPAPAVNASSVRCGARLTMRCGGAAWATTVASSKNRGVRPKLLRRDARMARAQDALERLGLHALFIRVSVAAMRVVAANRRPVRDRSCGRAQCRCDRRRARATAMDTRDTARELH